MYVRIYLLIFFTLLWFPVYSDHIISEIDVEDIGEVENISRDFWGNAAGEGKTDYRNFFCQQTMEKCIVLCFEVVDGTSSFSTDKTYQADYQIAKNENTRSIQSSYLVMIFICRSYCGMCVANDYE